MNIGKSLKISLLSSGKTQQQVANDLNCSDIVLNRHFNSKYIGLKLAEKYAGYFDIKVSELIALGE